MTEGFIDKKKAPAKKRADGKQYTCEECALFEHCKNGIMAPYGNFSKGIMIIGEAPGEVEDEHDKPWQGKTGRLLARYFRRIGIDIFEDCININAVRCRPMDKEGDNRKPTNFEIDCCRRLVMKDIEEYQPKVIALFGATAVQSVIGGRWKRDLGSIGRWRGFAIPDQDLKAWIVPTYHPSYVARDDYGAVDTVWEQDLKKIIEMAEVPFPRHKKPDIITLTDDLSPLSNLSTTKLISFDFETTGLKPHAAGHRIVCAAVADSENRAFTFMIPDTRKARRPFFDLLANYQIGKMAHNIKFEDTWCKHRLSTEVMNWEWDSMLAAHILDNRTGITSLKFQTYVNFGIIDYDSEVAPYLKGTDWKNGNSHNKIMNLISTEEGKQKLLTYCGYDAVYEYRLAMLQQQVMDYSFLPF